MEHNRFELTGKITWQEIKALESGNYLTRALLCKKVKDNEYESYPLLMFGALAARFSDTVKPKETTVNVAGRLRINRYENKDKKMVEKVELIVNEFTPVVYDEKAKSYKPVVVEEEESDLPWDN